jgi:hypothetical protein
VTPQYEADLQQHFAFQRLKYTTGKGVNASDCNLAYSGVSKGNIESQETSVSKITAPTVNRTG